VIPSIGDGIPFATSDSARDRFFGGRDDLLPLWIAEPYLPLAPAIVEAMEARATKGWYGYEVRPDRAFDVFGTWMLTRHGWDLGDLRLLPSPSVGSSMGIALDLVTEPGDGVIIQPPVFTDFKPLVLRSGREAARNPLVLEDGHYRMDLDHLRTTVGGSNVTAMILCNPHNPVGRVWSAEELTEVAAICAEHDVFVIADEIHADLVLAPHRFTPFATVAAESGVRWAAVHGPIKTFGVAGLCETALISHDTELIDGFEAESRRLHLARKNVFGVAAWLAGYGESGEWVDRLLETIATNVATLRRDLPEPLAVIEPEGTYLAWLDLRGLGLDVPELVDWLAAEARLALSPGHWFGREGAGFARMSLGVEPEVVTEAIDRLIEAVAPTANH